MVTPIMVLRLIRTITALDQVASDQAEFERTFREGLSTEIMEHGLRKVAESLDLLGLMLRTCRKWFRKKEN